MRTDQSWKRSMSPFALDITPRGPTLLSQTLDSRQRSTRSLRPRPEEAVYMILLTLEWEECSHATSTPSQRLAEEAQAQQAHPSGSTIPDHYRDFMDVFLEEAFTHLPPCKAWDHAIELYPDAKLPRGRTFPLSPTEQKELDEFLRENLANGCIHPSKSLIRAPVFFVKKKEGSLHLVQDYQKLNEITIKNSYPLLLVSDVLTRLHDVKCFI